MGGIHFPPMFFERKDLKYSILPTLLSSLFLFGCGLQERSSTLEQKQREDLNSSSSAEFSRSTQPVSSKFTIPQGDGKDPVVLEINAPENTTGKQENKQASKSEAEGKSLDEYSFPFFIKLIGTGLGLALIGGLIWFALRSSTALRAAWTQIDNAIGSRIKTVTALKGATRDSAEIASLTAEEARLNALRAEMAK